MNSITTETGGFDKVVFESVKDTIAGGVTLEVTGYTNADGIIPAGTLVGEKDGSTGLAPIIKIFGSGAETSFSAPPLGFTHATIPLVPAGNNIVGVVIDGVVRKSALPAGSASSVGGIATLGAITAGATYTNGSYTNVPLTGGTGVGATADITVAGTVVTAVTIVSRGVGYTVADALSALAANIGGTGTGFSVPVATLVTIAATNAEFQEVLPKITFV